MRGCALAAGGAGGWGNHHFRRWQLQQQQQRRVRRSASSSAQQPGPSGRGSYLERVKGWNAPLKAGLTSGSLSAVGDLLAQALMGHLAGKEGKEAPPYDPSRTLRMLGYGLAWYGPCQYYWYNLLDWMMPVKTTGSFLAKVALNQLVLAPVTLGTVFSWNLGLTGRGAELPDKLQRDLLPTMMNGWKFWIPAASLNFYCIPIKSQVLYMSACGVLWTAYLSYASSNTVGPVAAPAAAAAAPTKPCCGGKVAAAAK